MVIRPLVPETAPELFRAKSSLSHLPKSRDTLHITVRDGSRKGGGVAAGRAHSSQLSASPCKQWGRGAWVQGANIILLVLLEKLLNDVVDSQSRRPRIPAGAATSEVDHSHDSKGQHHRGSDNESAAPSSGLLPGVHCRKLHVHCSEKVHSIQTRPPADTRSLRHRE